MSHNPAPVAPVTIDAPDDAPPDADGRWNWQRLPSGRVQFCRGAHAKHLDCIWENHHGDGPLAVEPGTYTDEQRMEALNSDLDAVYWMRGMSHPNGPEVMLDWFVGDGGGHTYTSGPDIRAAVDAYLAQCAGDAPEAADA